MTTTVPRAMPATPSGSRDAYAIMWLLISRPDRESAALAQSHALPPRGSVRCRLLAAPAALTLATGEHGHLVPSSTIVSDHPLA